MNWDLKTATALAGLIGIGVSVGVIVGRYESKFVEITRDQETQQSNIEALEDKDQDISADISSLTTRVRVMEIIDGLEYGEQ